MDCLSLPGGIPEDKSRRKTPAIPKSVVYWEHTVNKKKHKCRTAEGNELYK